jgi:hypothetical protein
MNTIWVLASDKLESSGWNTDIRQVKLSIEGGYNSGPLSPVFLSEEDAWEYKDLMGLSCVFPVELTVWTPDMGVINPAELEQETNKPKVSRDEFLKSLLPELNALFGVEYKRYEEENK